MIRRAARKPGAIAPTRTVVEAAIREWAKKHPFIEKVWLYGSRISGVSSNTGTAPKADTDWDVAVEVSGANQQDRYELWKGFIDQAGDEMNAHINWKIDVQRCDLHFHDDSNVATAVKKYGLPVYERV
jgi:hypothetical protein